MVSLSQMLQPFIGMIVQAVIGIFTLFVFYLLQFFKQKAIRWLDSHTAVNDRTLVHRFAEEAFYYAESVFAGSPGPWKLEAASGYVSRRLQDMGLSLSSEEIRAAIEKAVLQYNQAKPQQNSSVPAQRTELPGKG